MKRNRVRETQDYLKARGINVSETAIVDAAIDLACRLGAGKYTFVCEFKEKESKGGDKE